jgi:release factor glutamine methyltransferase
LEYEPHTALFVPDNDPLLFYRHIAEYAAKTLKPHGKLYFEINPLYAGQIKKMLAEQGFIDIIVKEDQFNKQRMIKALSAL